VTVAIGDSAALATLADIELPAPPEWRPWILLGIALLVLAATLAGIRFAARATGRSAGSPLAADPPHIQALARLAALELSWAAGAVDDREAGFRLCAVLRHGFGLAQVDAARPPGDVDSDDWRRFVDRLRRLRYRPEGGPLPPALFEQARAWLAASTSPPETPGA
jgi:hypothetical protein